MKLTTFVTPIGAVFAALLIVSAGAHARLETDKVNRITIKRGYPLPQDVETLTSNLLLSRGVELYLWALPINQSYAGRDALIEASGGDMLDVTYFGGYSGHDVKLSTFNNETVYAAVHMELYDGPVVYEQPAMDDKGYLFGSIIDVWQVALTDLGIPEVTPDQGKGGKYLILPPDYSGEVPEGYLPIQSTSFQVRLGLRSVMLGEGTIDDAIARVKRVRVYPLSDPQRKQNYFDLLEKSVGGEVDKGVGAFRLMHDYISKEPIQEKDKYPIGMLRSLGIEKGQPFPTDRKALELLQQAADIGWMTAKYNMTQSWPPSVLEGWKALGLAETWDPDFTTDDYIQVDERAAYFGLAIWPPRNMGSSTYYAITFSDTEDRPLEPGKTYKLHLPPNVPATSFWSVILYDAETASMIENPHKKYAISSLNKNLQQNEDGSVDVFFGPEAPEGHESNWIPTTKNDFFVGFRIYGPDLERLGKAWTAERPVRISSK